MLGKNVRFVFDNGHCSFQTDRGQKIPMSGKTAWHKPTAKMDILVANALTLYLRGQFDCGMIMEWRSTLGTCVYNLIFDTEPILKPTKEPTPFIIDRIKLASPPPGLESLVNTEGAQAISWMLEAIFGKPFAHESMPDRLSWSPPPKKDGGVPLRRSTPVLQPTTKQGPTTKRSK